MAPYSGPFVNPQTCNPEVSGFSDSCEGHVSLQRTRSLTPRLPKPEGWEKGFGVWGLGFRVSFNGLICKTQKRPLAKTY